MVVAADPEIDARVAELQVAQDHVVEKRRQPRVAQPISPRTGSSSSPSAASISENGVALAQACGEQATG